VPRPLRPARRQTMTKACHLRNNPRERSTAERVGALGHPDANARRRFKRSRHSEPCSRIWSRRSVGRGTDSTRHRTNCAMARTSTLSSSDSARGVSQRPGRRGYLDAPGVHPRDLFIADVKAIDAERGTYRCDDDSLGLARPSAPRPRDGYRPSRRRRDAALNLRVVARRAVGRGESGDRAGSHALPSVRASTRDRLDRIRRLPLQRREPACHSQ
jgi:hypothetical protein